MSAPVRRGRVPELEVLTERLDAGAAQLARRVNRLAATIGARMHTDDKGRLCIEGRPVCPVCLTAPCDCLVDHEPAPTAKVTVVCPWCLEDEGWCAATGGPNPCAGDVDQAAALVDWDDAPTVHIPLRATGGAQ